MLLKETLLVRLLGLKVPMFLYLGPRVLALDDEGCAVEIPLGFRTKNHLGSMFISALWAGADLAAGLPAARLIYTRHRKVQLIHKDAHAEFLKRADGDVVFRTHDAGKLAEAVREADETGERVTVPVEVVATVPKKYGDEPVARFTLSVSMKRKDAREKPGLRAVGGSAAAGFTRGR
jgi:acyl-coenzyme A thioesterase PaaI-like protein